MISRIFVGYTPWTPILNIRLPIKCAQHICVICPWKPTSQLGIQRNTLETIMNQEKTAAEKNTLNTGSLLAGMARELRCSIW
jgi:hypothetical protein